MKPYIFVNLACIDVESLEILDYCSSSAKEFPVLMSLVVSGRKFTCPIPKEALEAWVKDYGILYYFFHRKGSIVCTLRESDVKMVTSEHAKILEAPVTPARRITT